MVRKPSLPVIIISDYTRTPPLATCYQALSASGPQEDNIIVFETSYKLIKSLLAHPPCSHRDSGSIWPCQPCEAAFSTKFWDCAAVLLDYYADFYAKDTTLMQSLWFYLLDVWQEGSDWLPYTCIMRTANSNESSDSRAKDQSKPETETLEEKAHAFNRLILDTIDVFKRTIWVGNATPAYHTQETLLHDPRGEAWSALGDYETGPWIGGVKAWCQFLGNGGPGVAPPFYPGPAATDPPESTVQGGAQPVIVTTTRYVPHAAIALLKTHLARARGLATAYFFGIEPAPDAQSSSPPLHVFDSHSLVFPTHAQASHTCTSRLKSSADEPRRSITYTLGNGAPPIQRPPARYMDADMNVRNPDWTLLDECVAVCRGWPAYEGAAAEEAAGADGGDGGGGGGGEEEDEDDGREEEQVFDMWTLVETRDGGNEKEAKDNNAGFVVGEMFDTWCGMGEF